FVPIVVDVATGEIVARYYGHDGWIRAVALGAEHKAASASFDGSIHIWNVTNGLVAAEFTHSAEPRQLAFSPDGTHLLLGDELGAVSLYEVDSGQKVQNFSGLAAQVSALAW